MLGVIQKIGTQPGNQDPLLRLLHKVSFPKECVFSWFQAQIKRYAEHSIPEHSRYSIYNTH